MHRRHVEKDIGKITYQTNCVLIVLHCIIYQGSYGCLKTLKVLEFEMGKIKPLKVLDFIPESLKVLGFHLLEIYVYKLRL